MRGTCVSCKKTDPEKGLIKKGELMAVKEVHSTPIFTHMEEVVVVVVMVVVMVMVVVVVMVVVMVVVVVVVV
jgi:hypothetical protein